DRFDGTTWQPADMERAGPATTMPPSGDSSQDGHDVTTHIRINGLSQQWLPMPYPATKVSDLKGGWLYDATTRNVYTVSGNSFGASYTVDSRHPELTADELRGAAAPPPDIADRY